MVFMASVEKKYNFKQKRMQSIQHKIPENPEKFREVLEAPGRSGKVWNAFFNFRRQKKNKKNLWTQNAESFLGELTHFLFSTIFEPKW